MTAPHLAAVPPELSFLGSYYTAISVMIVYHLFSLQQWDAKVQQLASEAALLEDAPAGHLGRESFEFRCQQTLRQFPYVQVLVFFVAVSGLCALGIAVAVDLGHISLLYTASPTVLLWLVFIAATVGTAVRDRRLIVSARRLVGASDVPR